MTDDLDALKSLMSAATPAPDDTAKAENLARAQEIFIRAQESARPARLTSDRPGFWAGLKTGVLTMLMKMTSRSALTATTSIAAIGLGLIILQQPADRSQPVPSPLLTDGLIQQAAPAPYATLQADEATITTKRSQVQPAIAAAPPAATQAATQAEITVRNSQTEGVGTSAGGHRDMAMESAILRPETDDRMRLAENNSETFANAQSNPVKSVLQDPVSTFSADVDTASYSVVRSSLMRGYLPEPEAVRIEEMLNYFPYDYAAPAPDGPPFLPTVSLMPTPWNPDTQLMHIAIQGKTPALEDRPPLNLVFLIDTSGSMDSPDKLPLLKQSFRLMLGQLRPEDQVAIVTYAGSAGRVLDPTPASDQNRILAALNRLDAGGSTAGQDGLQQAYATAAEMQKDGDISRILLATDGDFNVGLSDPKALETYIAQKRDSGTYLSVLGFGRGNLQDATMQALAQSGNGQAAYIDTLAEAQKTLVDQLTGALFPIADDVKLQVEFNPAQVAEYRLIGYETRALAREDFNNDAVDAGEIGAGYAMTALYEITAPGSPALLIDPSRYQTSTQTPVQPSALAQSSTSDEIGFLKLRYKAPGQSRSQLIETAIHSDNGQASDDIRFAAAIAGFGQLLRHGTYTGQWSYADAINLANGAKADDAFGYRAEAVTLMRLAQTLTAN